MIESNTPDVYYQLLFASTACLCFALDLGVKTQCRAPLLAILSIGLSLDAISIARRLYFVPLRL
jgi:hypothetical protein